MNIKTCSVAELLTRSCRICRLLPSLWASRAEGEVRSSQLSSRYSENKIKQAFRGRRTRVPKTRGRCVRRALAFIQHPSEVPLAAFVKRRKHPGLTGQCHAKCESSRSNKERCDQRQSAARKSIGPKERTTEVDHLLSCIHHCSWTNLGNTRSLPLRERSEMGEEVKGQVTRLS